MRIVMKNTELNPTQKAFRNAMASMAASVNVVTTNGKAGRCGITATAVCSITDTPPTVLVCINRNSEMNAVIKENGCLCINILTADHLEIAKHFAGMTGVEMDNRFMLHDWQEKLYNLPVLNDALANLQGRIAQISEMGTHSLFFVELEAIDVRDDGDGLAYFNRVFHRIPRN